MASSGSSSVYVTNYDTLKFSWWINWQSVENNNTNIGWQLELIAGSSGRISSTANKSWWVNVNGSYYEGTNTIAISNNATKTLASGSTTIAHNADGSKTFSYSFAQYFGITFSGSSIGSISGSGSGTLTTIPRATQPVIYTSNIDMGYNITITLPRASTSFAHVVYYKFAGHTETINGYALDQINWVIPVTLSNYIPNATSGTLYIYCDTYSGTTHIGTKSVSLTINVPSNVVPTISNVAIKEASDIVPSGFPYIQNKSKLNVAVSASGIYGSTITCKIEVNGVSYSGTNITSNILTGSGNMSVVTTVTDSRGRTASNTNTITVLAYSAPVVNGSLIRCNESGTEDEQGEYMKIYYDISVLPLNSLNAKDIKIQYKKSADTEYTTIAINATSYTTSGEKILEAYSGSSYDVIISATDSFSETNKNLVLSTAYTIFNIKANGKGFAFGKVSEKDGIEIAQEIYDQFGNLITIGDTGWIELPLNTGWYTYKTEYPYDIASYRKIGNVVYLRGLIGSTTEAGQYIGYLPAGCRPAGKFNRYIVCHNQYDTAAVQINMQGNIVDMSKANGVSVSRTFLNLSGLSFVADN